MEVVTFLKSSRGLVPYSPGQGREARPGSDSTRSVHRPPGTSRIVNVGLVFVNMNRLPLRSVYISSFIYQTVSL